MHFLANENIPVASIVLLEKRGYSIVSVGKECPGAKDSDIMKRAHSEKLVILTFDRDYGELIFKKKMASPQGVVYFRFDPATSTEPAEILIDILSLQKRISHSSISLLLSRGFGCVNALYEFRTLSCNVILFSSVSVFLLGGCGTRSASLPTYMRPERLYSSETPYDRIYVEIDVLATNR